jgi:GAF domain-containing protein/HAMP domain-containing protein
MSSPDIRLHQPTLRQSVRTRLLVLLVGLTTISVLTVGYLGVNSIQRMGEGAQRISAGALRTQAEEYLRQVTVGDARRNDLILEKVQDDAENLAQYVASVFEKPDAFAGEAYWQAEAHMFVGSGGQYMNDETETASLFVPNFVDIDEALLTTLELGAYLDFAFVPVYESDPNTVAVYLGTKQETTHYYPNIGLGNLVPPDFQVTQRPWYINAAPENNPERAVIWSPVYVDATGQGLMVTAAAPIYINGDEFIGAVGIDVTLQDISASIEDTRLLGSGYSFLIDDTEQAIALPEQGYQDLLARSPETDEVGADLSKATTTFAPLLDEMMAGSTGFETLEIGERELFVAYAPLESTGWSLANVVEVETVLQVMGTLQQQMETSTRSLVLARILPVGGGILVFMALVGLLLTNRVSAPVRAMAAAAQQIGAGNWDVSLPQAGNDEIGVLSRAFNQMTEQLRELYAGLEDKVAARTRDLERRSIQLEAATQVAREAAAIRDVDRLLDRTARRISTQFGFYHAGIFLLDDAGEYAVLQAASSEGGQRMLARRHRLKVGEVGIVGYAAGSGEPRIALDVGADAVFFDNPDLPQTRSEMALPLRVRDHVIGVLDVQSTEPEAFSDEDVAVLQTMADQVALAIENARLLEETQDRLQEVSALLRYQSRAGWERVTGERTDWGYVYDGLEIKPRGAPDKASEAEEEPQVTVPLQVRGTDVGNLKLALGDRQPTSDELALAQAIADQAGQALESARLFQETQRVLGETEALYRISRAIGAADSPEKVGQALVDYAATSGGVDVARVLLFEYEDVPGDGAGKPTHIVMREGWTVDDRQAQPYGTRLSLKDYPLADLMSPDEPLLVQDVLNDPRANEATRTLVAGVSGLRSFAMIPILVGERWLGVVFIGRDKPSAFARELIRGYRTLAGQAAIALESMRLLDETQYRATRERLTREITDKMRRAVDLDTLMQTTVREMAAALGTSTAFVQLGVSPETSNVDQREGPTPSQGDGRGEDGKESVV